MGASQSAEAEGVSCAGCRRRLPPNNYAFEHLLDQLFVFFEEHPPAERYVVHFPTEPGGLTGSGGLELAACTAGLATVCRTLQYIRGNTEPYMYVCPSCFAACATGRERALANRLCTPGGAPEIGLWAEGLPAAGGSQAEGADDDEGVDEVLEAPDFEPAYQYHTGDRAAWRGEEFVCRRSHEGAPGGPLQPVRVRVRAPVGPGTHRLGPGGPEPFQEEVAWIRVGQIADLAAADVAAGAAAHVQGGGQLEGRQGAQVGTGPAQHHHAGHPSHGHGDGHGHGHGGSHAHHLARALPQSVQAHESDTGSPR
ncbi:hypothetical protein HYH03_007431 [Edaphochlamys debaryana]|uniref:Uncharacterized protein n=1 Tax=Edaphochlamys debaryana TaxID=47281 RepID=A0A835YB91_9CHLO|nr:hypothetical protein HYH03_007431 [Edaphochlamys debaryana]|eukprot:KAG2494374.1 hypothetical protein HYH03_007431 [Edaphochlamys debaryana]